MYSVEQMRSQVCANKQSESYSCLLSDSLEVRGKGKQTAEITKRPKTAKEKSGEKSKTKSAFLTPVSHANSRSKTCQMNNWQISKLLYYSTIAWSKGYPYTCHKIKSYQAPASRWFQSICETNATTIHFSRGRKRTSSFPREVGLGTASPTICSSGDLPRGGKIRARKYWIWQAKR